MKEAEELPNDVKIARVIDEMGKPKKNEYKKMID